MKHDKEALSFLLVFSLLFFLWGAPVNAKAASSGTLGNLTGPVDTRSMLDHHLSDVTWGNGRFVAVGSAGLDEAEVLLSETGATWERVSLGAPTRPLGLSNDDAGALYSVAWNGSIFVAAGERILTSPDGKSWTRVVSFPSCVFSRVRAQGAQFVAVGTGRGRGCLATSPNGATWTDRSASLDVHNAVLTGVTWTGSEFLAVGTENQGRLGIASLFFSSPDGANWTRRLGPQEFLVDLMWTQAGAVAVGGVGQHGVIFTSLDAKDWMESTAQKTAALRSVVWNGALFVAVGVGGAIATSIDGKSWTARKSAAVQDLLGLAWNGAFFVAVGEGALLSSPDGIQWRMLGGTTETPPRMKSNR
ncbi:MAG: hypothetical protein HYZ50_05415 [Deltaproteobacteria bacterium]|nr:hypothetical protein [Deltaproteobacteria bacterium]